MGVLILSFQCCGCGLGVREAIACARSRCPVCYLLAIWQEEGSSNG
jgi:hypothetical protein